MRTNLNLLRVAGFNIALLLSGSTFSARASWPAGYYDSFNGKCGDALIAAIQAKMENHTEISYSGGTWNAFEDTDVRSVNGVLCWWDMYSNNNVAVSSGHPGMNVEHSVANSWWGGTKNAAYKDIVHLNPSNSDANSRKSNYPLAELSEVKWTNGVTNVGTPKTGQGGGNSWGYEPADEYKGDFARVFMYMFTVYKDISWASNTAWMYTIGNGATFRTWARELVMRWHAQDPVSDKERTRNDGVYKNQKNRNPFIDLPDLADHIWGDKSTQPFYVDGHSDPEDPEDPGEDTTENYEWLSSTSSTLTNGWTIEDITVPAEVASYVWSWKSYNDKYYLNGSAYVNGNYAAESYTWSPEVSFVNVEEPKLSFMHAAKFQTTLKDLCYVAVKDVETGAISKVAIPTYPASGSWTFVNSGTMDLSDFIGKKVKIGLHYGSTASGADTWEINDMKLTLKRQQSGMELPVAEDADDSFLVEVWGNNIAVPAGARVFDINGREVGADNLVKGIYIVAKPGFEKSVKVMIK